MDPDDRLATETVLAEWTGSDSIERTLGLLSPRHENDTGLTMRITGGSDNGVYVQFALAVKVKASHGHRSRELTLVIPPQSLGNDPQSLSFVDMEASQIRAPNVYSAAGDARLFRAGRIIRADFRLAKPGYVLMPRTKAKKIHPSSSTTLDLIRGLQSLSLAHAFSVYMKPSDCAREGLRAASSIIVKAPAAYDPSLSSIMEDPQVAAMNWSLWGIEAEPPAPPPYELGPTPTPPRHSPDPAGPLPQLFEDPANMFSDAESARVTETDVEEIRRRKRPLSPSAEDVLRHRKQPISEYDRLVLNLTGWIEAAMTVNAHVYDHPHLQLHLDSCAHHAVASDPDAFADARAALSAEFFFDPEGTGPMEKESSSLLYVEDMKRFFKWALRKQPSVETMSMDTFLHLGRSAKDAARREEEVHRDGDCKRELSKAYNFQKSLCVSCVILSCVKRP